MRAPTSTRIWTPRSPSPSTKQNLEWGDELSDGRVWSRASALRIDGRQVVSLSDVSICCHSSSSRSTLPEKTQATLQSAIRRAVPLWTSTPLQQSSLGIETSDRLPVSARNCTGTLSIQAA